KGRLFSNRCSELACFLRRNNIKPHSFRFTQSHLLRVGRKLFPISPAIFAVWFKDRLMIQVDDLTKFFGPVLSVSHINFQVSQGEIVGFLGPNGAGKTTTMRILTTYLPATSGIARVAGFDVMNESLEVRRNIGYLPESVPLYPEMRVD